MRDLILAVLTLSAAAAPGGDEEAPFNATHGRPRALQLNSCGAHPVELNNVRFGVGTGSFTRLLCDGGVGISYDVTVRTNGRGGGDRLAYFPTRGGFCGNSPPTNRYVPPAGSPQVGRPGISTTGPVNFVSMPCGSTANIPFTNPCCMVIECTGANTFNPGCEFWVDLLWYLQLVPFFVTSNSIQSAAFSTSGAAGFATGNTATFRRTLGGPVSPTGFLNSFGISNPSGALLTIYTVSGALCQSLPWNFVAPPGSQRDTAETFIQGTASCPGAGQCCTIVKCHRDNWGTGCQGLSYTGSFVPALPTPSPSPMPTPPPTLVPACAQVALPAIARAGTPLSALCFEPAPLLSHNFVIANPNFHRLNIFFTDGPSCSLHPLSPAFVDYAGFRAETTSNTFSANQIPCNAQPCCSIILCSPLNDAALCTGLKLDNTFVGPSSSATPPPSPTSTASTDASASVTPTFSPTPTATLSFGATPSNTPSTSFTSTATDTAPSATASPSPTPTPTRTPGFDASCSIVSAIPNLPAGGSSQTSCNLPSGVLSMSLANPNAHLLSLFFATGASCTAGLGSASFVSAAAFDVLDTADGTVARSGVPCTAPPCCFFVQCDSSNPPDANCFGCTGMTSSASFSPASGAAAAAAPGLSTPAVAGISVGVVLVVGALGGAAWWWRCGRPAAAAPSAAAAVQKGAAVPALNPLAAAAVPSINASAAPPAKEVGSLPGSVQEWGNSGAAEVAGAHRPPPPPPPPTALPPGWVSSVDAASGKTYFINMTTKATQWHLP